MDWAPVDSRVPGADPSLPPASFPKSWWEGACRSPAPGLGRALQPEQRSQVSGGLRSPWSLSAAPNPNLPPAGESAPACSLLCCLGLGSCGRAAKAHVPTERSSVIYITPPSCLPPPPVRWLQAGAGMRALTYKHTLAHTNKSAHTYICTRPGVLAHTYVPTHLRAQTPTHLHSSTHNSPRCSFLGVAGIRDSIAPRPGGDKGPVWLEVFNRIPTTTLNKQAGHLAQTAEPLEVMLTPCWVSGCEGERLR